MGAQRIILIILIFLKAFHQQIEFPPHFSGLGIVRSIFKILLCPIIYTSIHRYIHLFFSIYCLLFSSIHMGFDFHTQSLSTDPFTNWLNYLVICEIVSKIYQVFSWILCDSNKWMSFFFIPNAFKHVFFLLKVTKNCIIERGLLE